MYDKQRFNSAVIKLVEAAGRLWTVMRKRSEFLGLTLLMLPATLVIGSDSFGDVPDDHPSHNDINAIYRARITTGCGPGVYCPDTAVTRGQMAAFLRRGLGQVSFDSAPNNAGVVINTLSSPVEVAAATVKTGGGAPGGTGYVKVDATVELTAPTAAGCPCTVVYRITEDISGESSANFATTLENGLISAQGGLTGGVTTGSLIWVFQVPTQTIRTYRLRVYVNSSYGTFQYILARGAALSAVYIPFLSSTYSPTIAPPGYGEALSEPDSNSSPMTNSNRREP